MKSRFDSFGAGIRHYRVKIDKTLRQMARDLKISPAALSAIEVTNKKVSPDLDGKIMDYLGITKAERKEMEKLAAQRGQEVRIQLENASSSARQLASMFARRFDSLGDEDAEKINKILASISTGFNEE